MARAIASKSTTPSTGSRIRRSGAALLGLSSAVNSEESGGEAGRRKEEADFAGEGGKRADRETIEQEKPGDGGRIESRYESGTLTTIEARPGAELVKYSERKEESVGDNEEGGRNEARVGAEVENSRERECGGVSGNEESRK
jgi:hypothetical protein